LQPQIVAIRGPLAGRSFALGEAPLSFGRTPENTVVIASPLSSRRHAEVRRDGDGYVLADLGSSNGTLLNGQRVQAQRLRPGDVFEIGDEAFRFDAAQPAAVDRTLLAGTPPPAPPAAPPIYAAQQPPAYGGQQPPAYGGQQPLPPLPSGAAAPPPAYAAPPPAYAAPQAAPPAKRSRLPIFLGLGLLFMCVALTGLIGGVYALTRIGGAATTDATPEAVESGEPAALPTAGPLPTREPVAGAAEWTVLVYLDGDNNLEPDALIDFREMAEVGSSDQLNIVVQLDRISSPEFWDDTSAGDWEGTKRFRVERGMEPDESAALADLGEVNMGDPESLADFVEWGVKTYPANRYALIIWDHGASWMGVASDDTDDGDRLLIPELSSALSTAQQRSGFGTLDLIGFDACLMAQLDVFQAIQPFGQVAVASAELEPNDGWAWDAWLATLAEDPTQDARQVAGTIVDTYIDHFENTSSDEVTLSAFDLTKLGALTDRVGNLATAMREELGSSYTAIGQARSFVDVYAPAYPEEFNAIDLGHFAALLPQQGAGTPVAQAAAEVTRALEASRIANKAGSYHKNTSGISIYFPQLAELYVDAYERASPLPRLTGWADFLQAFHSAGETVTRPTIGDLQVEDDLVSVNDPTALTGTVSGSDIAYVFSFIGVPNAGRDGVNLVYVDYIYPPGAAPGDEPGWANGQYDLRLNWDATSWYLSNGQEQIQVLLGPVKYGTNFYGVEGVYTSAATGQQTDAGLIFEVSQNQGTLVRIWGFPQAQGNQERQPYELRPAAGDTFTAYSRSYTDTGARLEPGSVEGATITFTDQPMSVSYGPTPSGDYVMGFLVRDISGNYSYDYVDVTVDNSGANNQPATPAAPATSGVGAQPGFLAYNNPGLGFQIEHPESWQPYDTGREKIVFTDPNVDDGTFFGVDVYSLGISDPAAANSEILRQLLEVIKQNPEGEVRAEEADFSAGGQPGRKIEYVVRNDDGSVSYVVAIAVTSADTGRTYLVTAEAPEATFDAQVDTFNKMLDAFVID